MTGPLLPLQPRGFAGVQDLGWVRLEACAPTFAARKVRVQGARALGIKYEKQVHEEFLRRFPRHYLPSPWFKFQDSRGLRWCQPDGLLIDPGQGQIVIIEVKHSHTGEAWWKLQHMYLPVVRQFFGQEWSYRCLEVVRYYDPETIFPLAKLCEHVHLAPTLPHIGVHIWKQGK